MPILTEQEAKAILQKVLSYSKADECEANIGGSDGGNIRYARNAVSTSGGTTQNTLVVSSAYGKRSGVATINEFDDASLEKVVRRSEELAQLAPENPEYVSILGPQEYAAPSKTFVEATAAVDPKFRTDAVGQSLQISKTNNLVAAGYLENSAGFAAMMNSKGLFAYIPQPCYQYAFFCSFYQVFERGRTSFHNNSIGLRHCFHAFLLCPIT